MIFRLNLLSYPVLALAACVAAPADAGGKLTRMKLPISEGDAPNSAAQNFELAISATDSEGRRPDSDLFEGPSSTGTCKFFADRKTLVERSELFDRAFGHLDQIVMREGGIDAILRTPRKIPAAYIWGDARAPWRCFLSAIRQLEEAGYPGIGFVVLSSATGENEPKPEVIYLDFAGPDIEGDGDVKPELAKAVHVNGQPDLSADADQTALAQLETSLQTDTPLGQRSHIHLSADSDTTYVTVIPFLKILSKFGDPIVSFDD